MQLWIMDEGNTDATEYLDQWFSCSGSGKLHMIVPATQLIPPPEKCGDTLAAIPAHYAWFMHAVSRGFNVSAFIRRSRSDDISSMLWLRSMIIPILTANIISVLMPRIPSSRPIRSYMHALWKSSES